MDMSLPVMQHESTSLNSIKSLTSNLFLESTSCELVLDLILLFW